MNYAPKFIIGDSTNEDLFDKPFADVILTSPPCNVGIDYKRRNERQTYEEYMLFNKHWIANCYYWGLKNCRMIVNVPFTITNKEKQRPIATAITNLCLQAGWTYKGTIIWSKGNGTLPAKGSLDAISPFIIDVAEALLVFHKGHWTRKEERDKKESTIKKEEYYKDVMNVWDVTPESKNEFQHPAPFPKRLASRVLRFFSLKEDTIFDPFVGSGTTCITAKIMERYSVGVDNSEEYIKMCNNRLIDDYGTLFA